MTSRLGVLISGRGTNLQSLIDASRDGRLDATISVVISNEEHAAGLDRAHAAGIETVILSHRGSSREQFERTVIRELQGREIDLVCLAGFMRIFAGPMIDAYPAAILNIHPSLLPAFPGVDAQRQALEHGVKVTGVTVHLVTRELDGGPIVVQRTVAVLDGDTRDSLAARVLEQEHLAYPEAVAIILGRRWTIVGRRFVRL